eukprot:9036451-Prorocentrum_lima.AAC.1
MKSYNVSHECEWDHKLIMIKRPLGMVGMEVSSDNMWVVSPPYTGLSELARKVRDNSATEGYNID